MEDEKMKSLFEEMRGTYTQVDGGIYYPDLGLSEEEPHYGKYGLLRKTFLKEHRKGLYTSLLLTGRLTAHLNEIDASANKRMKVLIEQMKGHRHIDEKLKAIDQFSWIRAMNNIRISAEEIVLNELVYT